MELGPTFRGATEDDHDAVVRRIDDWAGGRTARHLLSRLWFRYFTGTSWVADRGDGRAVGIVIGFVSQDDPATAVLHLVAVDPGIAAAASGASSSTRFVADAIQRGAVRIRTTTWPDDHPTIAFLEAVGFGLLAEPGRQHRTARRPWPTSTCRATIEPSSSSWSGRERLRSPWLRIGLVAAAVLVVAVAFAILSGGGAAPPDRLAVGDCVDIPTSAEIAAIPRRACTEAHAGEVFHIFEAGGDAAAYPSDADWADLIYPVCDPAFATYTGTPVETRTDIDYIYLVPTSDRWAGGDRRVTCFIQALDGAPLLRSYRESR